MGIYNIHVKDSSYSIFRLSFQPIGSYQFTKFTTAITPLPFTAGGRFPRAWLEPPRKKPTSCGVSRLMLFPQESPPSVSGNFTQLRDTILDTARGQSVDVLRIGLESTSVYSFHPSVFLHHDESIRGLGANVFVMN